MPIEEKLEIYDKRITEQDKRLGNHDDRLLDLEKRDQEKHERLEEVTTNYENLESTVNRLDSTVTKENKETRETMREQTGKLFSIVEQAMGFQNTRTSQSHELKMTKLNTWSNVILKISAAMVGLLSSGGFIYYIITQLFK